MILKEPISIPVGPETLGRLINVTGNPIDGLGEIKTKLKYPIHRPAPAFKNLSTKSVKCLKPELKLLI